MTLFYITGDRTGWSTFECFPKSNLSPNSYLTVVKEKNALGDYLLFIYLFIYLFNQFSDYNDNNKSGVDLKQNTRLLKNKPGTNYNINREIIN